MSIDFDIKKYDSIKLSGQKFWDKSLGRPLIHVCLEERNLLQQLPCKQESELKMLFSEDSSYSHIFDQWDYKLSNMEFMGDGFPFVRPLFASSAMAIYMGCNYIVSDETIWFEPERNRNLSDIEIRYDPDNFWLTRTRDIYKKAGQQWDGKVQTVMTNLGGVYDILAMIIPAEDIVYAMYDQPEQIKRIIWQIHKAWWQYYDDLSAVIMPQSIGYMDFWLPIPCGSPSFLLQCDFCSLLSPELFDEFVKPELTASCDKMGGALFHLDGPDAVKHLDSLLDIENLKVIQWVPGDGQKDVTQWPELYRKVHDAGKQLMVTGAGTMENLDIVIDQIGCADGICYSAWGYKDQKSCFEKWLADYGIYSTLLLAQCFVWIINYV